MHAFKMLIMSLALICWSSWAQATETLTIAVASSLYTEMQQQVKGFEKEFDVEIRLVSGSTGRLHNQVLQGAPYDVFIAADELRPDLLLENGKAIAKYTAGKAYLGLKIGNQFVTNLETLTDPTIKHIGIANPLVAPFGLVTQKVLEQHGLWQKLKPKFVYAQNAMQTSMLVENGLVDAAFVPVKEAHASLGIIRYYGVLLKDKALARLWLKTIFPRTNAQLAFQMK